MPYERQKALRRELNERIPRGLRGSPQNDLRGTFSFFRMQDIPLEVSLEKALALLRGASPWIRADDSPSTVALGGTQRPSPSTRVST